ncbi:GM14573 [Drosophila sechellia]|uniref:GM14573 n=1 Tax=Drosophila sechellia TaxID=7238 RepID=B4HTR7_DROSE|nr:GM14573 [Drosophila sechellia]
MPCQPFGALRFAIGDPDSDSPNAAVVGEMPPPAMFVQQQQQQHIGDGSNILFFFQHFFQRFSVFSNLKISAPTAAPNSIRKMQQQQHRRSFAAGWPRVCVRDGALVVVSICVSSPNPKPNENRVLFSGPPVGPCALE